MVMQAEDAAARRGLRRVIFQPRICRRPAAKGGSAMSAFQDQIQAIQDRYRPQIEDLQRRGQKLVDDHRQPSGAEAVIGVDIDLDWKDVDIIFDVPAVEMKTTTISLDVPELRMETKAIIFHTPSVRMVDRKVGRYPEFRGFKVVWRDIIISVPEPFMQEQRIAFDLPTVTMRRQEWRLDLPQFRMDRVRWVVRLPQFTVRNVRVEADKLKQEGERLEAEGEQISERMKGEIEAVIGGLKADKDRPVVDAQTNLAAAYDDAIAKLNSTISELAAKGIDPIKVPVDGQDVNLRKRLADLIAERQEAMRRFEAGGAGS